MRLAFACTFLALAPALGFAQSIPDGDPCLAMADLDHEWFNKMRIADNDKDADGFLTWDEVTAGDATLSYYKPEAQFADADRNGDGKLENDELRTFNTHELRWVMEDAMAKDKATPANQETALDNAEAETMLAHLANPYHLNQHPELLERVLAPGYPEAHTKEVKTLLNNKWYLAQHPEKCAAMYAATELVWKRDPALSRWIRKHQAYMADPR